MSYSDIWLLVGFFAYSSCNWLLAIGKFLWLFWIFGYGESSKENAIGYCFEDFWLPFGVV